ncbi:Por secretion system C-terminal sorting domain-containing protein [Flavobacterium urocaniciphilum]|uniref:N-acetylmuramoyl-L-alanine amidase n=2 Tax=Flavobacterium urocaniciphilum TaxID=1299341 RepID=A0A1H9CQU0_9FLAO|nr:Por secretion system C-terminal sorting domain-containing protein [Flavobacterium urocaniciphilum]
MAVLFTVNVQSQVIVIDPGHGYGATTSDNPDGRTATEIETALEVGLRTRTLIQNSCTWTVQMTRTTNLNSWISVTQRGQMANNWNADRLLSIHCNAGGGTGTETFYCTQDDTNTPPDVAFAQKIQVDMSANGSWNNRRCVEDNTFLAYHLGVLRYSSATGCLNEIGFVDSSDATKLTSSTWRDTFALSYFNSLKADLNLTCATTPAPGAFTLTTTPECNGTTSQIKLTWTASSNATSYDLYRNGTVYASGLTGTTYTNTAVTVGTAYTYSVKAKNAGTTQTTNSNGTLSVTALDCNPIPGAFTLTVTPECSGTSTRNRLTWTASANATSYDVYRNGALYASSVSGTTYTNTVVTAGTSYSYYVKAKNTTATQTTNSNGTQTVVAVNCSAPGTFTISATAECNGTTSRINLTWTASANATSYDIYRNGSLYASDVTGTQFLNTYVNVGTAYTYSMIAKNNIGTLANSNGTVSATAIMCAPGSFTLSAIPTCSGTSSAINLTWTASTNATSYDIYRNGNLYASDITGTSFLNTYLITAGSTYTYYVKAKNSAGTLNNSNGTLSVTATNCSGAKISENNEVKEIISISFYPNPTNGILNLEINNSDVRNIDYMILDMNGRLIKEATLDSERIIDMSQLPSASYFVRVVVDGQEFVKQIVKK